MGFLPVFLIIYFLQYALPIFTLKVYSMEVFTTDSLPRATVEKAVLLALVGLICILFGYYTPGTPDRANVAKDQYALAVQERGAIRRVVSLRTQVWRIFCITLRLKLSPATQAYIDRPSDFFYIAIILFLILQLQGELSWGYSVFLWRC